MQIQQIFRRNNSEIQEINGNIVINTDHSILRNRDLPNQHPISAIEGLQDELNSKAEVSDIPTELSQLNDDSTHRLVTDTEKAGWNNKAETSDIPTNVSELNNDSNYQTNTEVEDMIDNHNEDITAHPFIQNKVTAIESKIPNQASSINQLGDKDFINSSLNSITAFYITKNANGDPFDTKIELTNAIVFYSGGEIRTPTRNDYCAVLEDETKDNATTRYIFQNNQWEYQYTVNETALTAAQLAAINSGITQNLVGQIGTNQSNISTIMADYIKSTDYAQVNKGGLIKISTNYGTWLYEGALFAGTRMFSEYNSADTGLFIGKGTLENVFVGKGLIKATSISSSSTDDNVVTPKAVYDFVNSLDSSEVAY